MVSLPTGDSKLRVIILTGVVSGIVILGSIGVVRYTNSDRQVSPAIADAAYQIISIPDSLLADIPDKTRFVERRDEFARQLTEGLLSVDSVRGFYHSYALWMRDGHWDVKEVDSLSRYLRVPSLH